MLPLRSSTPPCAPPGQATAAGRASSASAIKPLDAHHQGGYKRQTEGGNGTARECAGSGLTVHVAVFHSPYAHRCDSRVLDNKEPQTPSGPEGSSGSGPPYVSGGARLSFFHGSIAGCPSAESAHPTCILRFLTAGIRRVVPCSRQKITPTAFC